MKIKDIVPWKSTSSKAPAQVARSPFEWLQRDINKLFDDFFSDFPINPFQLREEGGSSFHPQINVEDLEDKLVVRAEVPGMDEKDINVSLTNDRLTISGEKKQEKSNQSGGRTYYESSYGAFERVIPLSDLNIDEDKIDASIKNGVLTLSLPKKESEKTKAKKLTIRTD